MVIWGAVWGAILGVIVPRHEDAGTMIAGALIGALFGLTLRKSIRSELDRYAKTQLVARGDERATAHEDDAAAAADTAPAQHSVAAQGTTAETATGLTDAALPAAFTLPAQTPTLPDTAPVALPDPPTHTTATSAPNGIQHVQAAIKAWLVGGNTVARVGAIVLFIGLAFLAKWAAENSLFPPQLRLAAVGLAGVALLLQGARLSRPTGAADAGLRSQYAYLLQGVGVAVLYLTVFAAFKLYAMIAPLAAFVLMALICALSTLLAVLADRQSLAFVGFAGAFATPILLATGEGNHIALFGYYLLLNAAIGVLAWLRAWRPLNLLGFIATFGIATAWGVLRYRPEHYASTQPFLLAFFVIYLLIGLFYALRHTADGARRLDGILIFGTPIICFLLQSQLVAPIPFAAAFSAVLASAIYVLLALLLRRRARGADTVAHWLALSYAALALGFATLAVPLAFDGRMTAAIWAIEGAGVFWLAARQARVIGQLIGVAMQLLAAVAFVNGVSLHAAANAQSAQPLPFANAQWLGHVMLALGSLFISWCAHDLLRQHAAADAAPPSGNRQALWRLAHALLFVAGFGWLLTGLWGETERVLAGHPDHLRVAWWSATFMLLSLAAWLAWRRTGWRAARYPALVSAPFLLVMLGGNLCFERSGLLFNVLLWPPCLALHLIMLRGVDRQPPQRWWRWVHVGNVLLTVLGVATVLDRAIDLGQLRDTDWAAAVLLAASTLLLLALASGAVWATAPRHWPLAPYQREYAVVAGAGMALLSAAGALVLACTAPGNTAPLPYLPLFNPVDLTASVALASVALWLRRARAGRLLAPGSRLRGAAPWSLLLGVAFVVVNTMWLRFAHHFRSIAWEPSALADSFFVQAGYSVLWTLLGVMAMTWAHRRQRRTVWQIGAGLLGLTVAKLLLVDLANSGGGERIVAFIAVGVLMVLVGYFAPLPPRARLEPTRGEQNHA